MVAAEPRTAVEDRVAVGLGRAAAEHQGTRMVTAAQDEGSDDEESARALHGVPLCQAHGAACMGGIAQRRYAAN